MTTISSAASERGRSGEPRVAIAHDYLTQRGGAERVALELCNAFPGAPLYTSVYWPDGTYPEFKAIDVRTSRLSTVTAFREDPRRALPFLATAWSRTIVQDVDIVICSSTGWAHGVATNAVKVVYCHNPARWLYQSSDYLLDRDRLTRAALGGLTPALRRWDRRAAISADRYLANSSVVAGRIEKNYGLHARVVPPPAALSAQPSEPIEGIEPGFLLTIGRERGYKNTNAVVDAVRQLPGERLVVVGGLPAGHDSNGRIFGLSGISDSQMRWLYQNCAALIAPAREDFGLTVVEAFAEGTPALCLRAGGYLDTMIEGTTGQFFSDVATWDIMECIQLFRRSAYSADRIRAHGQNYSVGTFRSRIRHELNDTLNELSRFAMGRFEDWHLAA